MKVTFTAGQRYQVNEVGDFFRLLGTSGPVNVEFYYQGREIAERLDIQAGFAEQFRIAQFDRIDIVSPTAQTVQWETALGSEIRYDRGAATVSGSVDLNSATINAIRVPRPEAGTGFYNSETALAANTADVVFTPAANVNGAIILSASGWSGYGGGGANIALLAKNAAPASITDGEPLLKGMFGGSFFYTFDQQYPQLVAAGKGLYFLASGAESNASRAVRFRLL